MIKGFDTAARLSYDQAGQLRNMGYEYAIRYCVPESYSKALTKAETDAILDAGLALGLCWETTAARAKNGAAAGLADGRSAKACAEALGAPAETIIWFAVDYEAPAADLDRIAGYMVAAEVSCRPYKLGIYGPFHVIEEMEWREIGSAYWQCVGWSGGKWSACADVQQREWNVKTGIVTVDNDYAKDITGMWRRERKPVPCPFAEPTVNVRWGSVGNAAKWVQWQLNRKGGYGLAVDGIFLSKSVSALKEFQRQHNLVVDGICGKNTRGILAK